MKTKRVRVLAFGAVTALAVSGVLLTGGGAAQAKGDGGPAVNTDSAEVIQAEKVAPLTAVASALGEQGRGAYADVYGNLYVDEDGDSVTLYVTDIARGKKLITAAKSAHPDINVGLVKVVISKFSKRTLDAMLDTIMPTTGPAAVTAVGQPAGAIHTASANSDASGITVTGDEAQLATIKTRLSAIRRTMAATSTEASDIPITVRAGAAPKPASWRWNDGMPQIGGDVLLGAARKTPNTNQCTAGISAEDSSGQDFLITAAHCYPAKVTVFGEGDAEGVFGFNYGGGIGTTQTVNAGWDAETISDGHYFGTGYNSDEADQPKGEWLAVTSSAYSYNGQTVYQDGARSYYTGHGVPSIKVTDQDYRYSIQWDSGATVNVRGVQGTNSNWAVTEGDSGAAVFSITSSSTRQARGIVSAMDDNHTMYWTESPDILSAFGLKLNPYT